MRTALTIAMLSLFAAVPAHAYNVETGSIMICDTQQQIERYVQLFDGNRDAAIKAVNSEVSNPSACAMTNVAYVLGDSVGMARSTSDGYKVIPVAVVAVNTGAGFQLVQPMVFYTLVKVKELAV
jgi:hypothetical protein